MSGATSLSTSTPPKSVSQITRRPSESTAGCSTAYGCRWGRGSRRKSRSMPWPCTCSTTSRVRKSSSASTRRSAGSPAWPTSSSCPGRCMRRASAGARTRNGRSGSSRTRSGRSHRRRSRRSASCPRAGRTRAWQSKGREPQTNEGLADPELAVALAAGNQDALLELYDRYAGLAYAVAMRVLDDPGRAEDVVQEAFLKVWTNAAGFDPKRGSLRTWLITAVRNRSIDYLRGRGAHERQEQELMPELTESHTSDPWREVSLALERMAVRQAVGS